MTNDDLRSTLQSAIATELDLMRLRDMLLDFKRAGGEKAAALQVMEQLRAALPEAQEDRLLELMDFAAGFCGPDLRVWPDE